MMTGPPGRLTVRKMADSTRERTSMFCSHSGMAARARAIAIVNEPKKVRAISPLRTHPLRPLTICGDKEFEAAKDGAPAPIKQDNATNIFTKKVLRLLLGKPRSSLRISPAGSDARRTA